MSESLLDTFYPIYWSVLFRQTKHCSPPLVISPFHTHDKYSFPLLVTNENGGFMITPNEISH